MSGDQKQSVFVVMGNDYPDAVFTTEAAAEAYCQKKKPENLRIFWRVYEFALQGSEENRDIR